jgi:hypothetical protein
MNKPEHNNKQLDPDYIKKEQEKTMKEWFGDDGYEVLDKMGKQREKDNGQKPIS